MTALFIIITACVVAGIPMLAVFALLTWLERLLEETGEV